MLLLDEATASVDLETDALIQKTLRESFAGCTIIAIAHRLHTILDYDRIIVMANRQVREFDTPSTLLAREGSLFRELALAAGIVT